MEKKSKRYFLTLGISLFFSGFLLGLLLNNIQERSTNFITFNFGGTEDDETSVEEKYVSSPPEVETKQNRTTLLASESESATEIVMSELEDNTDDISKDYVENDDLEETATGTTILDEPITPKYFMSPKDEKLNWFDALVQCDRLNMELVSIDSLEESLEVDSFIKSELGKESEAKKESNDFWTAGTNLWTAKLSEFSWATTGTKISFSNWHAGNPNFPQEQHCVELTKDIDASTSGNYKWNDYGCHIPARYICENPNLP